MSASFGSLISLDLNNVDVSTRRPNLRALLAIPSERQDVLAWLNVSWYFHLVPECPSGSTLRVLRQVNFGPLCSNWERAFPGPNCRPFNPFFGVKLVVRLLVDPSGFPMEVHMTLVETFFRQASIVKMAWRAR